MNPIAYFLNQSWLAHQEVGLSPLVTVELWIVAVLLACWVAERLFRIASRHVRGRNPPAAGATIRTVG